MVPYLSSSVLLPSESRCSRTAWHSTSKAVRMTARGSRLASPGTLLSILALRTHGSGVAISLRTLAADFRLVRHETRPQPHLAGRQRTAQSVPFYYFSPHAPAQRGLAVSISSESGDNIPAEMGHNGVTKAAQ